MKLIPINAINMKVAAVIITLCVGVNKKEPECPQLKERYFAHFDAHIY